MQFPPIKKGGNPVLPNPNMNVVAAGPGQMPGVVSNNDNYVKNIKKNPQNQT